MNMITTMIKIAVIAISIVFCSCGKSGNDVADKGELLSVSKVYSIGTVGSHLEPQAGNTYNPKNIADGDSTTTWAIPFKGKGSVILDLHVKSKGIENIEIYNGYGKSEKRFKQNSRAKEISIYSDKIDPSKLLWRGDLKDTMGFQQVPLTSFPKETSHIFIRIHSVYLGTTWNDLCISEVKFFGKSAGSDMEEDSVIVEKTQSSATKLTTSVPKAKKAKKEKNENVKEKNKPEEVNTVEEENFQPELKGEADPWSASVVKLHLDESQVESMSNLRYVVLTELQKKSLSDYWVYDTISAISENWADCTCMMIYCYWVAVDTIAIEKGMIPQGKLPTYEEDGYDVDYMVGDFFSQSYHDNVVVSLDGSLRRAGQLVSIETLKKEQDARESSSNLKDEFDPSKVIGCYNPPWISVNVPSLHVVRKSFRDAVVKRFLDAGLKFCIFG